MSLSAGDAAARSVPGTDGLVAALLASAERDPERPVVGDLTRDVGLASLLGRAARVAPTLGDAGDGPIEISPGQPLGLAVGLVAAAAAGRPVRVVARPGPATLPDLPLEEPAGGPAAWIDAFAAVAASRPPSPVVLLATTSGSTADPRPVGVTSFGAFVVRPGAHAARHYAVATPTATEFWHNLVTGGRLTLFALHARPFRATVELLARSGVEVLQSTPSVVRRLGRTGSDGALAGVSIVTTVGEPLGWGDVAGIRRLTADRATVINRYGMSEAHTLTQHEVGPEVPIGTGIVPVGRPVAGRTVHIELEDGTLVSQGGPGQVVVDGPFDRVVEPPLQLLPDGRRRLRTGDAGVLDGSGVLHLRGRLDRMVKIRGMRVEPEVLEDALRRLPTVDDAVIVPITDPSGESRLVAHLVVSGSGPEPADLRAMLAATFPDVLIPARFVLRRDALPLLPGGKVDLRALGGA